MKNRKIHILIYLVICLLFLVSCSSNEVFEEKDQGKIYLYGEHHAVDELLEKELELWNQYYHDENMRHLFIETSYFTAEYLNMWMKSYNDDILEKLYRDWQGSSMHNENVKKFYKNIKEKYPETIFHGTDVGHHHSNTGIRYIAYLEENGLENTEQYTIAKENIKQGRIFYNDQDGVYRENKMVENFIREFNKLSGESIMGIYGSAHLVEGGMEPFIGTVPNMLSQLMEHYGDIIYSEELTWVQEMDLSDKISEPLRVDKKIIREKEYNISYFGKQDISMFPEYKYREFWRIENSYEDFKDSELIGEILPYDNYPMIIKDEDVLLVEYTKSDDKKEIKYYIYGGNLRNGLIITEGIIVE